MGNKFRYFYLTPESGWKKVKIVCKFFKTAELYENYVVSQFNDIKKTKGPAITIGYGKNGKSISEIELCFDGTFFNWLIASHELMHLTLAYSRFTKPPKRMPREEWIADINSWFSSQFIKKFNTVFCKPLLGLNCSKTGV